MTNAITAFGYSDAAIRLASEHNMHSAAGQRGKWLAVRLDDGGNDGTCYDTRKEAVSHQLWPEYRFYCQINPGPMSNEDAENCLRFFRLAFDSGYRVIEPDSPDAIMPLEFGRNRAL